MTHTQTTLFEIELFIYIKMDLALNNLKRLLWHKTQTNKASAINELDTLFFLLRCIKNILAHYSKMYLKKKVYKK